jgi:hypothetical protein
LGPLDVDATGQRALLLTGLVFEVMDNEVPAVFAGKISMLLVCLAILRLLSEPAGLWALGYVLVTIRGPHVADLRLVRFVVAAMDHLLRPVLKLQHQMSEPSGHDFRDFLFHFDCPVFS